MIKIMRGVIILIGIVLVFMLLTACSTDGVFARKNSVSPSDRNLNMPENEEYSYDDSYNNSGRKYSEYEKTDMSDNKYSSRENNNEGQSYNGFYQIGYASWYGREFHGRKTASGERFDMNKMTAAHKKLPFGTKILVENLENGNSIIATVNDRGPYKDDRILDLSYAAAKKLGIVSIGEAKVGIKIIRGEEQGNYADNSISGNNDRELVGVGYNYKEENDYLDSSPDSGKFTVQAGAFYSRRNAERLQDRIKAIVDNPVVVSNENELYKVKVEKVTSRSDADRLKRILESENISSYIIENKE